MANLFLAGSETLCCFLRRDVFLLKDLNLDCVDGDWANMVHGSERNTHILKAIQTLGLCDAGDNDVVIVIEESVGRALQILVCNAESFDTICSSNHYSKSLGDCDKILGSYPALKVFVIHGVFRTNDNEGQALSLLFRSK